MNGGAWISRRLWQRERQVKSGVHARFAFSPCQAVGGAAVSLSFSVFHAHTQYTAIMSDHWLRKMRTYFTRIDFDKDGSITRKDFEGMAARFISDGKLDAAKGKELTDTLTAVSFCISYIQTYTSFSLFSLKNQTKPNQKTKTKPPCISPASVPAFQR